jgi:uncharacterized membrane protein YecN with MAPEG domain
MSLSKWTFQISDPVVNAEFKIYMQKNASKYMPVQVILWFFATMWQITEMQKEELSKSSIFLIGVITLFAESLFFYFAIKRYLWTIEISSVLTYLLSALLVTYANFRDDE